MEAGDGRQLLLTLLSRVTDNGATHGKEECRVVYFGANITFRKTLTLSNQIRLHLYTTLREKLTHSAQHHIWPRLRANGGGPNCVLRP